jgi:hypothetical protein
MEVFILNKVKGSGQITESSINRDTLGQKRTIPDSVNEKIPFSNFSNKKAYLALFLFVALLYLSL